MSSLESNREERVELADDVKQQYSVDWVYRSDYKNHKTKAVAVLVYGETEQDLWIQQRPENGHRPNYWEIVAGSQSVDHKDSEQAAKEEIIEELFGYGEEPSQLDLDYVGAVEKDTENPQTVNVYSYKSSRNDFPGSEEVQRGEFIGINDLSEVMESRNFTDCTKYVLDELESLKYADLTLEELAEELK